MAKSAENQTGWRPWVGLLLAPASWSGALEAIYLTNGYACAGTGVGWSHLAAAVGLVLCVVGGLIAWSLRPNAADKNAARATSRNLLMARVGIGLAFLFGLLTIAQWLPLIYGVPCSK
jgi:hypothetical protein